VPAAVTAGEPPLVGLRHPAESSRESVARLLVAGHPGRDTWRSRAHRGFLALAAAGPRRVRQLPLVGLRFPSESDQDGPSLASPRSTAPLRFLPSQRSRHRESTGPGLPRPDVPPPGFRTPLAACSSRNPPGLFHPGGALRVLALRSLPVQRSLPPRRRSLYPLAVGRSPAAGS
jgi:hypothetical protein